jgi:glycerol kinase
VRSQTNDTTSFGCALAAARADGINLIDFAPQNLATSVKVYHDTYLPSITDEDRKARNKKWKMAIQRSYGWASKATNSAMTSNFHTNSHSSSVLFSKL